MPTHNYVIGIVVFSGAFVLLAVVALLVIATDELHWGNGQHRSILRSGNSKILQAAQCTLRFFHHTRSSTGSNASPWAVMRPITAVCA